jgi:hypothetical protein
MNVYSFEIISNSRVNSSTRTTGTSGDPNNNRDTGTSGDTSIRLDVKVSGEGSKGRAA